MNQVYNVKTKYSKNIKLNSNMATKSFTRDVIVIKKSEKSQENLFLLLKILKYRVKINKMHLREEFFFSKIKI